MFEKGSTVGKKKEDFY